MNIEKGRNPDGVRHHVPVSTVSKQQAEIFDYTPDRDWLNPISMSRLKLAVEAEAKRVALNGTEYKITYGIYIDLPVSGDRRECVRLDRVDGGLAPFGYVSVARLKQFEFEENK